MPLGTLDVELAPDLDKLAADIEKRVGNLSAEVNVGAVLDTASTSVVDEKLAAAVGDVSAQVVATPDLVSAEKAAAVLDKAVGTIEANVVAQPSLGGVAGARSFLAGIDVEQDAVRLETAAMRARLATSNIGDGFDLTRGKTSRFTTELAQSTAALGGFSSAAGLVPPQLQLIGAAAAAALAGPVLLAKDVPAVADELGNLADKVGDLFAGFAESAAPGVDALLESIGLVLDAVEPLFPVLGEIASVFEESVAKVISDFVEGGDLEQLVEGVGKLLLSLEPLIPIGVEFSTLFVDVVAPVFGLLGDAAGAAAGVVSDFAVDFIDSLLATAQAIDDLPGSIIPDGWIDTLERSSESAHRAAAGIDDFGSETEKADTKIGNTPGLYRHVETLEKYPAIAEAAAAAAEQMNERTTAAFNAGPSIADLVGQGKTPEEAVAESGKLLDDLNRQAFGLATLRTAGFKDLLAEAVSIDDPAKAGEFIASILELPPEKQMALEAAAAANTEAVAAAAAAVAEEQGKSAGVALSYGIELGIIEASPELVKEFTRLGEDIALGIRAGMEGTTPEVLKSSETIAAGLAERMRTKLEIESPSRVFAEIGRQVGAGLVQGLDASGPSVATAVDGLVPTSLDPIAASRAGAVAGASVVSTGADGLRPVVVNVNAEQVDPWRTGAQVGQALAEDMYLVGAGAIGRDA